MNATENRADFADWQRISSRLKICVTNGYKYAMAT